MVLGLVLGYNRPMKLKCSVLYSFLALFLTLSSVGLSADAPKVVGLRFSDYRIVWDLPPSEEEEIEALKDLWVVLLLPSSELFVDLRSDRSVSDVTGRALMFSRLVDKLISPDYELKLAVRSVLTSLGDEEVRAFWQAVANGEREAPKSLRVRVEVGPGKLFLLRDGILIKDLPLQITVLSDDDLFDRMLQKGLENYLMGSASFRRLESLARIVVLAQELKELVKLKERSVRLSSYFDSSRMLGLLGSELVVFDTLRDYRRISRRPTKIYLAGKEISLSGTIDFAGITGNVSLERVDMGVEEALAKMQMFTLGRKPRLVPSALPVRDVVKEWMAEVDLEPFWNVIRAVRRSKAQALVSVAFGFQGRRARPGDSIMARYFLEETRRLFKRLEGNADWVKGIGGYGKVKFLAKISKRLLPSELAEKYEAYINVGWLPFAIAFVEGNVVAFKLDRSSKEFFSALLKKDEACLRYVARRYRSDFWSAVKHTWGKYEDPLERELRLLEVVSSFKSAISPTIPDPWLFIRTYLRKRSGVDPYRGIAVHLESR